MKKVELVQAIEKAIKTVGPKGPGHWTVEVRERYVVLDYSLKVQHDCWPCPHPELKKSQDAIWKKWGGDQIVGDLRVKSAAADGYTDKYGDEIYCEYVTIEYEEEEEEEEE